jgi:hypothetical protein
MNIERIPLYSLDLIQLLDAAFPRKCIGANERPEDAHRYAGKREVVDLLLRLAEKTETDNTLIRR